MPALLAASTALRHGEVLGLRCKPSITLDTYCHLLGGQDNDAAKQAEEILLRVLR